MNQTLIITTILLTITGIILAILIIKSRTIFTLWDYETGLHFKNGKFVGPLDPGRTTLWGTGHELIRYDNRLQELVIQGQELLTGDKATVKLSLVIVYRINNARRFHDAATSPLQSIYTQAQLVLRKLVGGETLEQILDNKTVLAVNLTDQVKETAEAIGIEITEMAVRDIMVSSELRSAYTQVITAREAARAELEKARGEAASLRTLANAARVFEKNPDLLQLRYLQTLEEIGSRGTGAKTLVMGRPEDWLGPVQK